MFRAELNRFADGSILKIEGRLVGDWADEVKSLLSRGPGPKGADLAEQPGSAICRQSSLCRGNLQTAEVGPPQQTHCEPTRLSGRASNARYGLMREGMSMLFHGKFQNRNVLFGRPCNVALLVVVLAIVSLAMSGPVPRGARCWAPR